MNKKPRNDKIDGRYYTDEYIHTLTKRIYDLEKIIKEIKEELTQGITFCENDSQGHYDVCNIAINREKKMLDKIKELEEGVEDDN